MDPLDTQVDGDTGSVRTAADGIGALGGGLGDAADGFSSAAGQSESQWSGSAGNAFRGKITSAAQATQLATTATKQVRDAMHTFADQMDQVKAKMSQAEFLATGAGLTVSGSSIQPPTQPPSPPTNVCYSPQGASQMAAQFKAAVAKYRMQLAAYKKAEAIIKQARQQEQAAHQALTQKNDEAENLLSTLDDHKYWIAGDTALSTAAHGLDQAEEWAKKADKARDRFNGLIDDLSTLPEDSDARLAQLRTASRALDDVIDSNDAEDANKVLALGLNPKLVKIAGYGLTAVEIAQDVINSKGRAQNLAGDAASLGVNMGTDELIGELSLDTALETGGVSIAAGGLAIGTGYVVQHYGPDAWDWANKQLDKVTSGIEHLANPLDW